jgi:hypothetical protein
MIVKIKEFYKIYERKIIAILLSIALIGTISIDVFGQSIIPNGSISSILIFLALLAVDDIVVMKKSISNFAKKNIGVFPEQTETNKYLESLIDNNEYKKIYLIEYSSMTVKEVLENIITNKPNIKIYLLLQHPSTGSQYFNQEKKILDHITNFYFSQHDIKKFNNIKILFYKQRASIRGRNFDNKLINIGWYFYEIDESKEDRVKGHTGITINFEESNQDFHKVKKFFNTSFKNLWDNASTVEEVFGEYKSYIPKKNDFPKWCKKISSEKENRLLTLSDDGDIIDIN